MYRAQAAGRDAMEMERTLHADWSAAGG